MDSAIAADPDGVDAGVFGASHVTVQRIADVDGLTRSGADGIKRPMEDGWLGLVAASVLTGDQVIECQSVALDGGPDVLRVRIGDAAYRQVETGEGLERFDVQGRRTPVLHQGRHIGRRVDAAALRFDGGDLLRRACGIR